MVADELETAREAAGLVRVDYDEHAARRRAARRPSRPVRAGAGQPDFPTDTAEGDVDAALAAAAVVVDATYTTPAEHNNPMEPHATVASGTTTG